MVFRVTDAEGSFSIVKEKGNSFRFSFKIELHKDDIEILHFIAKSLGVGKVYLMGNCAIFSVVALKDIVRVIIPIFTKHPLLTTKALDFSDFAKAVEIKNNSTTKSLSDTEFSKIKNLKARMNSKRVIEELEPVTRPISAQWLLGFIEGEGTFGYKNLVPYFQIGQHKRSLYVLKAIEVFLINLPRLHTETLNNNKINVITTLNKNTDVYSICILNIDVLYDYVLPFFNTLTFLSRKSIDLHY